MTLRLRLQLEESLGSNNRWYCSQCYGREISDPETLLRYYIASGGAADFAERYQEAMGAENRWYCSEYYRREVSDPETLWHYYNHISAARETSRQSIQCRTVFEVEACMA